MQSSASVASIRLLVSLSFLILLTADVAAQVLPGIDVLVAQDFAPVRGRRVGLVMNQTAVRRDPRYTTLDAFQETSRCRLTALFAPEHGIDGSAMAGEEVGNRIEPRSGLPIYSLYGGTRKPTRQMLKDLDVMVYDIQDVGVRSYTYISTLIRVMEGCAEANIPLVVLDRPNPLGGEMVDGPVLDPAFRSFVGIVPVAYVHGMTVGELATMANAEGWLENGRRCSLTVIRCMGWSRWMDWRATGLRWVPPSPHVPTPEAAFGMAATGAIGEISAMSIGIGYTLPFELLGTTWLDGRQFASRLNDLRIPGMYFRPTSYKPFYGMSAGKVVQGVHLMRTASDAAPFTATVAALTLLRDMYAAHRPFDHVSEQGWQMFDKVCGTDAIRRDLLAGVPFHAIVERWQPGLKAFLSLRQEYLLYE